jgi:hypothetical protein
MVRRKKLAGWSPDGQPAVLLETHGGLYAIFLKKKQGGFETIATAPHIAIACYMAERKCPGIRWEEGVLMKSDNSDTAVDMLREAVFSPLILEKSGRTDYIVYDAASDTASIMDENALIDGYASGQVEKTDLVRLCDMSEEARVAYLHPKLGGKA